MQKEIFTLAFFTELEQEVTSLHGGHLKLRLQSLSISLDT